jgi:hypothetical protein
MSQINSNSGNPLVGLGYLGNEPITPLSKLLKPGGGEARVGKGTMATPRPKGFPPTLGPAAGPAPRAGNGSAKDLGGTKQVSLPIKEKLTAAYFENDTGRGTSISGQVVIPLSPSTKVTVAGSYEYRDPDKGATSGKWKLESGVDQLVYKDGENSLNAGVLASVAFTDTYAAGRAGKVEVKGGPGISFKHRFGNSGFDAHAKLSIQRSATFVGGAPVVGKYVLAGQGGFGKSLGKNGAEIHLDAAGELNLNDTGANSSSTALILGGTIPILPKQGISVGLEASYTIDGSGSGTPSFPFAQSNGDFSIKGVVILSN